MMNPRALVVGGVVTAVVGGIVAGLTFAPRLSCEQWDTEAFFKAATANDVSRCLEAGANIEARGGKWQNKTPLHRAAASGSPAVVKVLLDAGADIDARTPSTGVVYGGEAPLHLAAASGSPAVVKILLDAGANVEAFSGGGREGMGSTPLHRAGSAEVVKVLLDAGANIDARGFFGTPLNTVRPELVKVLVDAGANIEAGGRGTPLHRAAQVGNLPLVKALLAAGANTEARGYLGETPLSVAARIAGSVAVYFDVGAVGDDAGEIVKALLAAGANIEARDELGWTPLHVAVGKGLTEWELEVLGKEAAVGEIRAVVKALLDAGANPKAKTFSGTANPPHLYGLTPWDLTQNNFLQGTDVDRLLQQAQSD